MSLYSSQSLFNPAFFSFYPLSPSLSPFSLKGVSKPVFKGLSELLKYLLQCIEEEFQKEPEAAIFSAFLIFRLAFCIYLQPKEQPNVSKLESEHSSPFSFLFSSRGSETTAHISSRGSGSTSSASSSSRSSPDGTPAHSTLGAPVLKTSSLARHVVSTSASTPSDSSSATPVRSRRSGCVNVHSNSPMVPNGRISEELDHSNDLVNGGVDLSPLRIGEDSSSTSTATPSNISTPMHSVGEGSGGGRAESEVQLSPPHPIGTMSHSSLPVEASQLTHVTHNGVTRDSTTSPNNTSNISTANTSSPHPTYHPETPPPQFPHRSESPVSSSKKQNRDWNCPQSPTLFPPLPEGQDLTGCTFLYKDLMKTLGNTRTVLLNRQFWNVLFMSTVDMDRNYLGWNERTAELYER